ncbi:uncharacterized protein LOC130805590 [Amaranthus tricolor]|uniref:uncharacterized protein LOC130805590 n=1 Tax=Amaranthus tricolor TaxID=29722 RepID=UPI00258C9FBB|nr:uncharacterized protein LOC130805590 [Amaranthus tricolor]
MIEYCDRFNIQIRFSSVSRPQTNGQVESANNEIPNGIKKKIEGAKETWDEELPRILWTSRITIKEATGHTPFSLVYGSEAVLTVEIDIPSTRITYYSHSENEEEKIMNLDLLLETRGNALYGEDNRERKAGSQLGWPIQNYPLHQTRDVRIRRYEREKATPLMERRSLEEILHLTRSARGHRKNKIG